MIVCAAKGSNTCQGKGVQCKQSSGVLWVMPNNLARWHPAIIMGHFILAQSQVAFKSLDQEEGGGIQPRSRAGGSKNEEQREWRAGRELEEKLPPLL